VFFYVFNDAVLNDPFETIELRNGGFQVEGVFLVIEDGNTLVAAENIEAFLAETLEFELVLVMDLEANDLAGGNGELVYGIIELGIIGDEPVDDAERNARLAVDDGHHGAQIGGHCVELEEIFEEEIVLGRRPGIGSSDTGHGLTDQSINIKNNRG
jgi:hypothetical protein